MGDFQCSKAKRYYSRLHSHGRYQRSPSSNLVGAARLENRPGAPAPSESRSPSTGTGDGEQAGGIHTKIRFQETLDFRILAAFLPEAERSVATIGRCDRGQWGHGSQRVRQFSESYAEGGPGECVAAACSFIALAAWVRQLPFSLWNSWVVTECLQSKHLNVLKPCTSVIV